MANDDKTKNKNSPLDVPKPSTSAQAVGNKQGTPANQLNIPNELSELRQRYTNERDTMYNFYKRDRFFLIEATNGTNLSAINTIQAYEDLKKHIKGTPRKITERRDGKLTIVLNNEEQCTLILTIKTLANVEVTCSIDGKLNQSQGTIRYDNRPGFTIETLKDNLKQQNVTDIYQITRRANDKSIVKEPIYILTFNTTNLPARVTIGWSNCPVRLYIPKPRRCFKCQRFGHGKTNCRSEADICATCALPTHEGECTSPEKCKNCNGNHPSYSRKCPIYEKEQEILAYKAKNQVTYAEAKREVKQRFTGPSISYSRAVKNCPPSTSSQPNDQTNKAKVQPPQPKEQKQLKEKLQMDLNNNEASTTPAPLVPEVLRTSRSIIQKPPDPSLGCKRQRENRYPSIERLSKRPNGPEESNPYPIQMIIPPDLPTSTAKSRSSQSNPARRGMGSTPFRKPPS